jgi:8-oxo-dGTP pyrophosphatase MutT (NUDIX family)
MPHATTATALMRSALHHHEPSDPAESAHVTRALEWLATATDPLNRNLYNPGHAVGSALIVTPDRTHVLLVLHAKLNRWLQAGGHAEADESDLLQVARREAREEVGCDLSQTNGHFLDIDIHTVPARKAEPQHLHFDFRYLFIRPMATAHASSDALEARWFTLIEALNLDLDPGLRRMIGKVRSGQKRIQLGG